MVRIVSSPFCNRLPYPDLEVLNLIGFERINEGGIVGKVGLGYDHDIVVHGVGSKLERRTLGLWNGPPLLPASYDRRRFRRRNWTWLWRRFSVLGVDLGKNVCSVVGLDSSGAVVMRRKMRRETLIGLAEKLPPCIVGMEACCGAHHLGRMFAAHAHAVRLMSPEYVRPYVKAQKNDDRDAEGIAEAATRPTMRFVELKSQDQLDMQTLHRSRDRLVSERTALINQLRAILLERGMVAPQGKRQLEQFLTVLMDEQGGAGLSPRMILLVADARAQWAELDRRISAFDAEFLRWAKENEDARRLATSPGLVRSSRLRLSPRLGERRASSEVVISRPGSAWSLGSSPPAANRSCSGSASEATNTCADS